MKNVVAAYRRAVRRRLRCSPADKRQLTETLDRMLIPLLEDYPEPDTDTLHTALGRPEAVASDLLAELPASRVKRWKYICRSLIAALILVVFAFLLYEAVMKPIELVVEEGETITTTPIEVNDEN